MKLLDAAEPVFARHETFHPRYGWFRKAYSFAALDSEIFKADDAPVRMGVGKNMVRAIRFWGQAAKIITKDPNSSNPRSPGMVPTRIGKALFSEGGWDPYMEDPGTVWLLHWLLLAPPSHLPVWWLAFNEFHAVEFEDELLHSAVASRLELTPEWKAPHQSSLKKDVSALLRTYAPAERPRRIALYDVLDCPLRELGLIRHSAAGGHRFILGPKPSLPIEILGFAMLDYLARVGSAGNTVTLAQLVAEAGCPGLAFKVSESDVQDALGSLCARTEGLELLAPAGVHQLSWTRDPAHIAVDVLNSYYGVDISDVQAGTIGDRPADTAILNESSDNMVGLSQAAEADRIGAS